MIEFAARLLPHMAPGLGAPTSVRDEPRPAGPGAGRAGRGVAAAVRGGARRARPRPGLGRGDRAGRAGRRASAALDRGRHRRTACSDADHGDDVDHQVDVVPATLAKGLEFDRVVVVEPAAIVAGEPDERTGLRRLYVVLTRAVSELTVVHSTDLPGALRNP